MYQTENPQLWLTCDIYRYFLICIRLPFLGLGKIPAVNHPVERKHQQ
jgi:hypothetical protein